MKHSTRILIAILAVGQVMTFVSAQEALAQRKQINRFRDGQTLAFPGAEGASLVRDAVDKRLMNDIKNRTGKLLDSQDEVGGWPKLKSKPAPKDADRDGMADAWETANNLDPKNPNDRNGDAHKDGYTNLEEYLNSLCPQLKE
ncbi:MAG: hypothetical protein FVQ84_16700 [Planctomycetes bacterium]|nr:hypothetical protein [Planctomycetota bacterium]